MVSQSTVAANRELRAMRAEVDALTRQLAERTAALDAEVQQEKKIRADFDSFTYNVSHDLREPLRALDAFSQFLIADFSSQLDDDGRDFLRRLGSGSQRMRSLIDDLVALSRAGRIPVTPTRIDTDRLVRGLIANMRPMLSERGGVVEIVGRLPAVAGEEKRLQQAFEHLLTNGIKFNESERPTVTVRGAPVADMVELQISDNGIGIEPEFHERVFGIFQRARPRDEYDGNGAGLAIARHAIESLSGSVRIAASGPEGTTFAVTLPRAGKGG